VGGASNTGGAVLRKHFSDDQLTELTRRMNPEHPTGLVYTVLPSKGERFPVNDPDLEPKLTPRPNNDAVFLQAMLEGMARTEAEAFQVLQDLGATPVTEILTCGGGAKNHVWTQLRARAVGVPVAAASNGEAAYGAALLARRGWLKDQAEASNKGVELFPARVL
jgi:D-ribulokinase